MLKKEITYIDFEGRKRTEPFYFNFTDAELVEWEMSEKGGLSAAIKRIIPEEEPKKIIEIFKDIILKAYGEKGIDGKHFLKSDESRHLFTCTAAYSALFMELAFDAASGAAFINGLVSAERLASAQARANHEKLPVEPTENVDNIPATSDVDMGARFA